MTQPLDPSVFERLAAMNERLLAKLEKQDAQLEALQAKVEKSERKAPEGVVDETLREVFGWFDRVHLAKTAGTDGARKDRRVCRVHAPLILDLEFEFAGKMIKLGDQLSLSLTPEMGAAWIAKLQTAPRRDGRVGTLGPSYRNRMIATLQTVLTKRWGKARNPVHGWEREGVKHRERVGHFQDEAALEDFLRYARRELVDMAWLAVDAGCMRLSEVAFTKLTDIDWEASVYVLPAYRTKNGEKREFPLADATMERLRQWKARARPGNPYLFQTEKPIKLVQDVPVPCACIVARESFPHPVGHLCVTRISRWMHAASEKSGLNFGTADSPRQPSCHDFRRTGATWFLEKTDGNLDGLQASGGWLTGAIARKYAQRDRDTTLKLRERTNRTTSEAHAAATPAPAAPPAMFPSPRRPPAVVAPSVTRATKKAGR